jgi:uncharacterized protein YacL (UPF0231 family)
MIICGARRGYRFDSMDINRLRHFAEILEAQYIFVDHLFQTISKPVLQFRFHNINKIQDDIIQLTQVEEFLNVHQEQQMDSRNTTRSYSHLLQTMEIPFQAFHFQYQAQKYIKTFHEYKDSILQIRQRHQELQQEQFLEISSTNEPGMYTGINAPPYYNV